MRVVIEDVLAELVKVREGSKTRTISKLEAILQAHLMNALKGNPKAGLALFKLGQKTGMFSRAKPKPCLVIDARGN